MAGRAFAVLLTAFSLPGLASGQIPPPDDVYVTLRTAHFRVTFPEDLEELGRRAAGHAETAYELFSTGFFEPPGTVDLLVTDRSDLSIGFARVFPTLRITIWAQPPVEGLALSHYDDWLALMVTHEVAHAFHLDYAGAPGRLLRGVFRRVPERWPYFSAQTVPLLAIEGIAVHEEFHSHGSGRLEGTLNEAIVRTRWADGIAESVDQGIGASPIWPGRDRRYVHGGLFFQHLADTRGQDAVVRFLRLAAEQWIPYRLDAAAREAFGSSLEALWDEWMGEVARETQDLRARIERGPRGTSRAQILTAGGAFAVYAAAGLGGRVAYIRSDEQSDIQLRLLADGEDRSLGRWNTVLAPPRWTPEGDLVVPQADYVDSYRLHRDLYVVTPEGSVTRLTRGLRVVHADPHPAGGGFAAVLGEAGTNRLARLATDGTLASVIREAEPGVHWSFPAWSPDGSHLAVVRRALGGGASLLLLDPEGAVIEEIAREPGVLAAPSWGPGGESLVWSSDRSGVPNLYGVRFQPGDRSPGPVRQITDLVTAGIFPSVDPRGEWIYLSVLGSAGWELARIPYAPDSWSDPAPLLERYEGLLPSGPLDPGSSGAGLPPPGLEGATIAPYSALLTLLPRYWRPIRLEGEVSDGVRVLPDLWGLRTSGSDLVGRHAFTLEVGVPLSKPTDRAEGAAHYSWAGLGNPVLHFETGQSWEFWGRVAAPGEDGAPAMTLVSLRRERFVGAAAELTRRRLRGTTFVSVRGRWIRQHRETVDGKESDLMPFVVRSPSLLEARLSAGLSTIRSFPFSVSTQEGISLGIGARRRWDRSVSAGRSGEEGVDGSFDEVTAVFRAYRGFRGPGYAPHVLAVRVAGGIGRGPGAGDSHFFLGGADRFLPVRGFAPGSLAASTAWSASAEWRFPVALINRGFGAWPVHADRLSGAVFWDWAGGRVRAGGRAEWDALDSFGAELTLVYSLWFEEPGRVRFGVAFNPETSDASAYVTSGWSF